MPQSTVPAVIAALQTTFVAAVAPLAGANDSVPVSIGPPPGGDLPAEYVSVAWAHDSLPSILGTSRQPELGNPGQVASEAYSVWCAVSTSSGDELGGVRIARTDSLFQACVAALRANRNLNSAIRPPGMADVGTFQWQIEEGGRVVTVWFEVAVDAGLVM